MAHEAGWGLPLAERYWEGKVAATRLILYGIGPIGLHVARAGLERNDMAIVGAVDIDPAKVGRDLGELLEPTTSVGVQVGPDLTSVLSGGSADIVVLCTSSRLDAVYPQIAAIVEAGINVISTCEELAFPTTPHVTLFSTLDDLARKHGVTICGTGVNPGYVMDVLPIIATAPCLNVSSIAVKRVLDASGRRRTLQKKVGARLLPEDFRGLAKSGVIGHVGLEVSASMIAHTLGWTIASITNKIDPVIAENRVQMQDQIISKGEVAGLHQRCVVYVETEQRITLDLSMYAGAEPLDQISITGTPSFNLTISGGLHGDVATSALIINSIARVLEATPGVLTPNDMPIPHWRQAQPR